VQRWLVRHPRFTLHFTPTALSLLGGPAASNGRCFSGNLGAGHLEVDTRLGYRNHSVGDSLCAPSSIYGRSASALDRIGGSRGPWPSRRTLDGGSRVKSVLWHGITGAVLQLEDRKAMMVLAALCPTWVGVLS
jgi:hypothetical protein